MKDKLRSVAIGHLSTLRHELTKSSYSTLELRRFAGDLENTIERFIRHEYKKSSFISNRFNISERAEEFFVEVDFYCRSGRTWEQVFKTIPLKQISTILDLCPGYLPKAEIGLFYCGYRGKVLALDKDRHASKRFLKFISFFNPKFTTSIVCADLFSYAGRAVDVVIGNHIIDDIALDYFSVPAGVDPKMIYALEKNLKEVWRFILSRPQKHSSMIIEKLVPTFSRIINKQGRLLFSQYPAYLERILDLKIESRFSFGLLQRIVKILCASGFYDDSQKARRNLKKFNGVFRPGHLYLLRKG